MESATRYELTAIDAFVKGCWSEAMLESLQAAVQRVLAGSQDEADLQLIAAAIQTGQIVLATGERAIAIGGDANNSVNVSGDHNHVIVINGVEAEEIAQRLQQLPSAQAVSVNELIQQVRSRASTKILNLFSKIRLLNKRQIEVDRLYVDVYVLEKQDFRATIPGLLEGRDAREQFERFGLGKRGERSPGLAISAREDYPRLMVLGKPGSGKSTFLRHLAVGCAKGEFLGDYIPVLLELRDVDEATFSLAQWIHEEFELEQEAQTEQILKRGQVLILLDGLDEVPSSLQQKVQSELRKFAKRYSKNRFILSCRTQTTEYIPEQFQAVEVADFNLEQVESFALNWFTVMAETPEQGMELKDHFMEKLRESPQTAELAVTPVLLSLTCWIFDDLKSLPRKRSDLYREGLDLLLQQWDEGRGISRDSGCNRYQQLTTEERKRLLSYLAFRKFEQAENFVLFEEPELCGYIAEYLQISADESQAVLQAIAQQHGLLVKRAHGIWSFSHLTFQEYLVAKWFCDQANFQSLTDNITNYRWREVFLLTSELVLNRSDLLSQIKQVTEQLVADNELIQSILDWIGEKANSLGAELFRCKQVEQAVQRQALLGEGLTKDEEKSTITIRFSVPEDSKYEPDPNQQAVLRGFCLDLICNYNCESSIIGDVKIISQLNLYMSLKKNDKFINSVIILDYSLSWFFAFLRFSAPYFPFDHGYPELTKALQKCAEECGMLTTIKIVSIDFFDKLLTLWQSFLSIGKVSKETLRIWWKEKGESLAEQLREVAREERNICHDWHLTEEFKDLIQKYYTANRLLVDCISNTPNSDLELIEEITNTLFLPIAEIEKRKNQSSD